MIRPVPRHEPEIIAAGARRCAGDLDKVPTTALRTLTVSGVQVSSRYRKAHEMDRLAAIVVALPAHLRGLVVTMSCDSKAGDSYELATRSCSLDDLTAIARAVGAACFHLTRGYNGIRVRNAHGAECSLDANWSGDVPMIHATEIEQALADSNVGIVEAAFRALIDFPHRHGVAGADTVEELDALLGRTIQALGLDQAAMPAATRAIIADLTGKALDATATYAEGARRVAAHRGHWRALYLAHLTGGSEA